MDCSTYTAGTITSIVARMQYRLPFIISLIHAAAVAAGDPIPDVRIAFELLVFPACYRACEQFPKSQADLDFVVATFLVRLWGTGLPFILSGTDQARLRRQLALEVAFDVKLQEPVLNPEYRGRQRPGLGPLDCIPMKSPPSGTTPGIARNPAEVVAAIALFLARDWTQFKDFFYPEDRIVVQPEQETKPQIAPEEELDQLLRKEMAQPLPVFQVKRKSPSADPIAGPSRRANVEASESAQSPNPPNSADSESSITITFDEDLEDDRDDRN